MDLNKDTVREDVSFSLWEYLDGFNSTIVADSAIPYRYHITTSRKEPWFFGYFVVEKAKIEQLISKFDKPIPEDFKNAIPEIIELYESVRKLNHFSPEHCPIVEAQSANGKRYFLQYHRSRDFEPAEFELMKKPKRKQIEASFVRGATPPEGMTCNVIVRYGWCQDWKIDVQKTEDGSFDFHYHHIFSEIMARRRKLQMINQKGGKDFEFLKFVVKHDRISKLHKPQVSAMCDVDDLFYGRREFDRINDKAYNTHQDQYIQLKIISDGRKAYIKRV